MQNLTKKQLAGLKAWFTSGRQTPPWSFVADNVLALIEDCAALEAELASARFTIEFLNCYGPAKHWLQEHPEERDA